MQDLKERVTQFLNENDDLPSGMFRSDFPRKDSRWLDYNDLKVLEQADELNFLVEFEDNYGGEDCGREYWSVYKFTDKETAVSVYVKFDGWYASYVGSEYEEWYFVEPVQVMKTEFNKI